MPTIETIIHEVNRDLVPQFEERLRGYLANQDTEWLIDQIVRLALDAQSLSEMDRKRFQAARAAARSARIAPIREIGLDRHVLAGFLERYRASDRPNLMRKGYLLEGAPAKGTDLIGAEYRRRTGTPCWSRPRTSSSDSSSATRAPGRTSIESSASSSPSPCPAPMSTRWTS